MSPSPVGLFIGDFQLGLVDRDALEFGQIKFGGDFHFEAERHIAVVGQRDRFEVEVRLAERLDGGLFVSSAEAFADQAVADVVGDVFAEAFLKEAAGGATDAEAGHGCRGAQFAVHLVELGVDAITGNRDGDFLLERAGIFDRDGEIGKVVFSFDGGGVVFVRHYKSPFDCCDPARYTPGRQQQNQ
jgi:hypothetical protein